MKMRVISFQYLDRLIHHWKTEFRMETEGVNVPDFIGGSYASVVELYAVVGGRNIVPGPIAVQPIVEIL